MEPFKQYLLQELQMKDSTIQRHLNNMKLFVSWATRGNHPDIAGLHYNDLLGYIQYEKQRNIETATISLRLASIRHYYEYLKHQGEITRNPAKTLYLRGTVKAVVQNPLAFAALEKLYGEYAQLKKVTRVQEITALVHQRNIVMLGLLVWQGVHSGELKKLETGHIDLDQGIALILGSYRSNSRELKLASVQMMPLHTYLKEVRPQLKPKGDELFPGDAHYQVGRLVQELQGINPAIRDALHIRASVILHWLKLHNKRQVQYMAGHKYISSTEKYAVQDMETLSDALSRHHPFG